jgi:hypothetical protein
MLNRIACALLVLGVSLPPQIAAQGPTRVDVLDIHHLTLGDGKVSDQPRRGYVYSCRSQFRVGGGPPRGGPPRGAPPRGGGAQHAGAWIHGATWDLTEKVSVRGRVTWPQAQFSITSVESGRLVTRAIAGNGLPVNTPTGNFPVASDDPAFLIDRNPNTIRAQDIALSLAADPTMSAQASCVPMGMIGVALNGVAIFNALDDGGRDAVAHEVQDLCGGHPQMRGEYHYHGPSPCLPDQSGTDALIGYALDGFGITSIYDGQGKEITNADLDECHGRVSEIPWNGKRVTIYHYVLTREYPYTVGCFRGAPAARPRPQ